MSNLLCCRYQTSVTHFDSLRQGVLRFGNPARCRVKNRWGRRFGCDDDCTPTGCGNGVVTPNTGEQCEDGNPRNGDCCSSTCHFEASGSPCADDGNQCTDDVCNGAG